MLTAISTWVGHANAVSHAYLACKPSTLPPKPRTLALLVARLFRLILPAEVEMDALVFLQIMKHCRWAEELGEMRRLLCVDLAFGLIAFGFGGLRLQVSLSGNSGLRLLVCSWRPENYIKASDAWRLHIESVAQAPEAPS